MILLLKCDDAAVHYDSCKKMSDLACKSDLARLAFYGKSDLFAERRNPVKWPMLSALRRVFSAGYTQKQKISSNKKNFPSVIHQWKRTL
jgi:hypothetical protein